MSKFNGENSVGKKFRWAWAAQPHIKRENGLRRLGEGREKLKMAAVCKGSEQSRRFPLCTRCAAEKFCICGFAGENGRKFSRKF